MSAAPSLPRARSYRFIRLCFVTLAVILFAPIVIAYVLANASAGAR